MTDLHRHLRERLLAASVDLGLDATAAADLVRLDAPKNKDHGDIALGAFQLAKLAGKAPPAFAAELAAKITPDAVIESSAAAGPFVNFRFRRAALAREVLSAIQSDAAPYGKATPTGEVVCIDFSSPNIAKPFHIGHMRSTVIGNALCRIHRHQGATVHGINHLGDWGMPFAKMMTAYMHFGDEAKLHESPMRYMFELYKRYGKEAEANPGLDDEAAKRFKALESGVDNDERRMWQLLRDESLKAFQGPYTRLGVTFDHVTGESFFEDKMEAAMARVTAAGVLEESEGAEVVKLEDKGIKVPCLLRKSDGTTLYHTRDLAAVFYREQQYHPNRILYVVGAEQKLHFAQLKAVLEKMNEPIAAAVEHVPFGLVLSKTEDGKYEKFASRAGNAVFLDEILDESVAKVRQVIAEKNPDLDDKDQVAEQVGVSAIVFNDLKNSRIKDVKFDWDAMLAFEGETGPYVQYAVARLSSILRKVDAPVPATDQVDFALLADAERVLLQMMEFGNAVRRAAEQSEPSVVTSFAIALAGEIHSYLVDHYVVGAEPAVQQARLVLVDAARRLLTTALDLLGIPAPERM
ncbi:MAG: arginine--tRNA ligase [Planctomycetes bacterium]|nr:arginine--tRNA ligase [Planctomycetota bacterium]